MSDQGVTPSGSGHSATPEPVVSALRASVPNADREADEAHKLGQLYTEIRTADYGCSYLVCTFPHDGNCWCFNRALAQQMAAVRQSALDDAAHCAAHLNGWGYPPAPELADHIAKCIRDLGR